MNKVSKLSKLIAVIILASLVLVTTGCAVEDKPKKETLILSIDNSKVYLDEMMYHIMLAELQGQLYEQFVGDGESYWDSKDEDGVPMSKVMKDLAIENAIKYEIFNNLALEQGYLLTEEEIAISKNKVDSILKSIPKEKLQVTELTEESLTKIQEKITLATRYYEDYLKKLGVDEELIKADIDQADYKQYEIEYIFAPLEAYDELSSLLEEASATTDWTKLTISKKMNSGILTFLEGDNTFGEESSLEDAIKLMKVDEVSNIIETVKGYYIIKLKNNTSTSKYDKAVKDAMESATLKAFEPAYETLKKEHEIKVNTKAWKKIKIGNITI